MASRPTIQAVARYAHVSIATVSRVINAHPSVDKQTRQLVWKAIRTLGYEVVRDPNVLSSIVVLAPKVNFNNYFWQQVAAGILSTATETSTSVSFLKPAHAKDSIARIRALRPRDGVLGVLVVALPRHLEPADWIPDDMDTVVVNILTPGQGHQVGIDMSEASRSVTRELIHLGHRRIAIAINSKASWGQAQRLQGVLDACAEAHIKPLAVEDDLPFDQTPTWLRNLLDRPDRPTALIGGTTELSHLLWDTLHHLNVTVPTELSFVGYGHQSQFVRPRYNTISHPTKELGSEAVRILRQAVIRPDRPPIQTAFSARIDDVGTVGPAPPE